MKLLILSSDPTINQWKTLSIKLNQITAALNTGTNGNFTVELRQITTRPLVDVITGRINRDWIDNLAIPYYKQGYDIVGFHFNGKQYLEWNIKPKLGGSNPRSDVVAESLYWWSDETSKRKGIGKFVETCLHEICHGYYQKTGLPDQTHATDAAMGTVVSLLPTFDWSVYQKTQIKRLEAIVAALKALLLKKKPKGLIHPVAKYAKLISQTYGTRNTTYYPQTKHHIGTDYACPVGTPVRAPWDGGVTVAGTSPALGNFCHYKYIFNDVTYVARFMHLTAVPYIAPYKRGEVIELSGKTGKVSGPHLHVDIFYNEVRVDILTEKNFKQLTINPETHYEINP